MPIQLRTRRLDENELESRPRLELTNQGVRKSVLTGPQMEDGEEWEITLPSRWGLELLERVAASVALGRGLPSPWVGLEQPDRELFFEAIDCYEEPDCRLRPSAILQGTGAGVYLPWEDVPAGAGSAVALREETLGVLRQMGVDLEPELLRQLRLGDAGEALAWLLGTNPTYAREALEAVACAFGAESALASGLALQMRWVFDLFPVGQEIPAGQEFYYGFGTFRRAWCWGDGRGLGVSLASSYAYEIPVEYLCTWYSLEASDRVGDGLSARVVSASLSEGAVDVALSTGEVLQLSASTILGYCEPDYEDFGFRNEKGLEHVRRWMREAGPFRRIG